MVNPKYGLPLCALRRGHDIPEELHQTDLRRWGGTVKRGGMKASGARTLLIETGQVERR